ncbi:MAG: hypothetical protein IT303_03240 [Dehalococcoidia bacterium]|nr:hypothetical protein [Dehalococcoidia bacterium]
MRMLLLPACLALLAAASAACDSSAAPPALTPTASTTPAASTVATSAVAGTATPGPATVAGHLADPALAELSGLAASRAHPGVYWAHNDSGDRARIFALAEDGASLAAFAIDAEARDWEDIALGPGPQPGAAYLYIGDIGDNAAVRDTITVYRVREPDPAVPASASLEADAIVLTYPGGAAYDAEALAVDPATGDFYIATKALVTTRLFVARAANIAAGGTIELEQIAELGTLGPVTAADIAPSGGQLLLRTYTHALVFEGVASAWPTATPARISLVAERQGEALAITANGTAFITTSEGAGSTIYRYPLAP